MLIREALVVAYGMYLVGCERLAKESQVTENSPTLRNESERWLPA